MAVTATDTHAQEPPAHPEMTGLMGRAREAWDRLDQRQKILFLAALGAVIALIIASALMFRAPSYRILFSNISERDGGAIIASLEQMNIPYRFTAGGSAILIPSARVDETRLRLAAQGLPKGGNVGFELMENQRFGISQFAEQINYQRGLEGELSRTIQSIAAVATARVHLAIPRPTVFVREELKPSASVFLNLHPGRFLEPIQIVGIQNLVAASVPNLSPNRVTLIDQSGAMISQLRNKLLEAGLDPTQLKFVQEIEANIIKRITDILTPVVGPGNARAQVAADIDFSKIEQTAETFRPNVAHPDIAIRSQQTVETATANPIPAVGVPGALTNQPPVPPTVPLTQPQVPGATPPAAGAQLPPGTQPLPGRLDAAGVHVPIATVTQPMATRKEAVTNYEVDRTIRHVRSSVGTINRLSAAVVVNHRRDAAARTGVRPLTELEVQQITDLVKDAMGFSQDRGDTISVVNVAFAPEEKGLDQLSIWTNPLEVMATWNWKEIFVYTMVALIIAYILLGIVRPLVKTMLPPPPPAADQTASAESGFIGGSDGDYEVYDDTFHKTPAVLTLERLIEEARKMVRENPRVAANIIKDWTGTNAP